MVFFQNNSPPIYCLHGIELWFVFFLIHPPLLFACQPPVQHFNRFANMVVNSGFFFENDSLPMQCLDGSELWFFFFMPYSLTVYCWDGNELWPFFSEEA